MFLTKSKVGKANLLTKVKNAGLIAVMCLWGVQAMAADGLTTLQSRHGPKDTMNRLEAEVKAKGMTVFARIDHAAGAAAVGLPLRSTELLIFGNAKGGTPLTEKNSVRAYVFRFAPELGHCSVQSACLKCARNPDVKRARCGPRRDPYLGRPRLLVNRSLSFQPSPPGCTIQSL
jgi:hypothetical protein